MKININKPHQPLIHLGARSNVTPNEIVLLEADSNYTYVTLSDGSTIYSATTMGVIEKRLKSSNFFRPNRSTIVNLNYLENHKKADSTKVSLKLKKVESRCQNYIKISRRRQADFFERLKS